MATVAGSVHVISTCHTMGIRSDWSWEKTHLPGYRSSIVGLVAEGITATGRRDNPSQPGALKLICLPACQGDTSVYPLHGLCKIGVTIALADRSLLEQALVTRLDKEHMALPRFQTKSR